VLFRYPFKVRSFQRKLTSMHVVSSTFFTRFKEARNSFFDLEVYLLKPKFRIEGKHRFP